MENSAYWFPAKRYGWGWGLPTAWPGWLVLLGFVGLCSASAFAFPPSRNAAAFALCIVALAALLFAICLIKGEPPAWRWGKRPRR